MTRKLPAFMVARQIGANRKIRRLTPEERWCFVAGVLAVASEAPERGTLFVAVGERASFADYADAAGVSEEVAKSAVRKLRRLKTIVPAEGGGERVKNWDTWNPPPSASNTPEAWAERQRRSRAKRKGDQQQAEAEGRAPQLTIGEGGTSLKAVTDSDLFAPPTGNRRRSQQHWAAQVADFATAHYPNTPKAQRAVEQAIGAGGCRTAESVHEFIERFWPELADRRAA